MSAHSVAAADARSAADMEIRRATAAEAELLRSWRNDPEARRMFRNPESVDHDSHMAWLRKTLADDGTLLLVGVVDREPVGSIRFDRQPDDLAVVNINIAGQHRGRGLGRQLLDLGCRHAEETDFARVFRADIKTENAASHRLFRSLGFVLKSHADGWDTYLRGPTA
jgi:RimJ/RimL family protein N-acetyltransferase